MGCMSNDTPAVSSVLAQLEAAAHDGRLSTAAAANIRTWLTLPHYEEHAQQVTEHIAAAQWPELEAAFWNIIPFGTAGRRGLMYPIGSGAINDRTMAESAQGVADYVRDFHRDTPSPPAQQTLRCAIAYDTRHQSRHFAELCAGIMAASGFEVLFFGDIRATPELSFTVRDRGCACGLMISASHNPPSDNAIKVFWSTGGQLRPPHDAGVIACVARVTKIHRLPFAQALAEGRITFCEAEQDIRYSAAVLAQSQPGPRNLKISFSPLHGVGLTSIPPILNGAGFEDVSIYEPHATPDGNFPNVPDNIANPENAAVFDALIAHAERTGAELILASDPDADRIGCAARVCSGDSPSQSITTYQGWQTLTGNQIGVLLAELLLCRLQAAGKLTPEHYIVKTLVTGDMVCRLAAGIGARVYGDVLTGFKWIGGLIDEIGPGKFVFGFEEAHGYLAGTYTRDKDGAVAALLLAELAAECKAAGRTLHEQLDSLYLRYGCHQEKTVSMTLPGADGLVQMAAMMGCLRTTPPAQLGGLPVRQVHDYSTRPLPLTSDLLIFELDPPGNRVAVRPSGTEPKIKFYLFAAESPEESTDILASKQRLSARLAELEIDLLAAAGAAAVS